MIYRLSVGNRHEYSEERLLYSENSHDLLMDRAYEDNEARELAIKQEFIPVAPPRQNRKDP